MATVPKDLAQHFSSATLLKESQGVSTWAAPAQQPTQLIKLGPRASLEVQARLWQLLGSPVEWLGEQALALPYLTGPSLSQRLQQGPLSPPEVARLGLELCRQLEVLHQAGYLHGDLKPDNIMADPPRLIDFGHSRLPGSPEAGTPLYWAPEQAGVVRAKVGVAADLFALGLVLYEAASGVHPFAAPDVRGWLQQLACSEPAPLQPPELGERLAHLLDKDPRHRPASAAAVAELLEGFLQGQAAPPRAYVRLRPPPLIGRSQPLEQLQQAWQAAREHTQVLKVAGPAGLGKSRLLGELTAWARAQGAWVLAGAGGKDLPWQSLRPIAAAIRQRAQSEAALADKLRQALVPYGNALSQILPELGEGEAEAEGKERQLGAQETQEALVELLHAAAQANCPTVVVLEDQHWSPLSLHQLCRHLARDPRPGLLLLASFRPGEMPPHSPLAELAGPVLQALEPAELQQLLTSMAGALPPELSRQVSQQARGNPFQAMALLRGLIESGGLNFEAGSWQWQGKSVGSTDQRSGQVLADRLQGLEPQLRQLLEAGAILGRSFRLEQAQQLLQLESAQWEQAWELALLGGDEEQAWFSHDLVREGLLQQLDPEQARRLHLRAAQLAGSDPFALARHWSHAQEPQRALGPALEASRLAMTSLDAQVCFDYSQLAQPGWDWASNEQRRELLELQAEALLRLHRSPEALQVCQQALQLDLTPLERARILGRKGEIERDLELLTEQVNSAEALQRLLQGRPLSRWRQMGQIATGLGRLLRLPQQLAGLERKPTLKPEQEELLWTHDLRISAYFFQNQRLPLIACLLESLNLSLSVSLGEASVAQLLYLAGILQVQGWSRQGRKVYDRARPLASEIRDSRRRGRAFTAGAQTLWLAGDLGAGLADLRLGWTAIAHSGQLFDELACGTHLGFVLIQMGRLPEADRQVAQLSAKARAHRNIPHGLCGQYLRALLSWGQIAEPEIPADLDALGRSMGHFARGLLRWRQGRLQEALEEFTTTTRLQPLHLPLGAWAWRVQCCRQLAQELPAGPAQQRGLQKAVREAQQALKALGRFPLARPQALRELGLIRWLQGRFPEAQRQWQASLELARRWGMPVEEALTLVALGRLDPAQGRQGQALLQQLGVDHPYESAVPEKASLSQLDRFEGVLELGRELACSQHPEQVLDRVFEGLQQLLRPQQLMLVDAQGSCLRGEPIELSQTLWRQVLDCRQVVIHDQEVHLLESLYQQEVACALLVPILQGTNLRAVGVAYHRGLSGYFGEEEVRLARLLASQAGVALEHFQASSSLRVLLEHSGVALALLDRQGEVVSLNPAFQQRLEALGSSDLWSGFLPAQRPRVRKLCSHSSPQSLEATWSPSPGSLEQVQLQWAPVPDQELAILSLVDISHRRTQALLRFQELERQFLAAELHDGISQDLAALCLGLSGSSHALAKSVLGNLSALMGRLRNPNLEGLSLRQALRRCVEQSCANIQVEIRLDPQLKLLEQSHGYMLYRIVQEACVNIARHSQAQQMWLWLRVVEGRVRGEIGDDGVGFSGQKKPNRLGLTSMQQRAKMLGGKVRILSHPGGGTRVLLSLPLG